MGNQIEGDKYIKTKMKGLKHSLVFIKNDLEEKFRKSRKNLSKRLYKQIYKI